MPRECKGEEKADDQEEGREGKTALPNPEEEHELEISLKISAGRRLDEPSRPPLEGEEGLLSPTRPPQGNRKCERVGGEIPAQGRISFATCHAFGCCA